MTEFSGGNGISQIMGSNAMSGPSGIIEGLMKRQLEAIQGGGQKQESIRQQLDEVFQKRLGSLTGGIGTKKGQQLNKLLKKFSTLATNLGGVENAEGRSGGKSALTAIEKTLGKFGQSSDEIKNTMDIFKSLLGDEQTNLGQEEQLLKNMGLLKGKGAGQEDLLKQLKALLGGQSELLGPTKEIAKNTANCDCIDKLIAYLHGFPVEIGAQFGKQAGAGVAGAGGARGKGAGLPKSTKNDGGGGILKSIINTVLSVKNQVIDTVKNLDITGTLRDLPKTIGDLPKAIGEGAKIVGKIIGGVNSGLGGLIKGIGGLIGGKEDEGPDDRSALEKIKDTIEEAVRAAAIAAIAKKIENKVNEVIPGESKVGGKIAGEIFKTVASGKVEEKLKEGAKKLGEFMGGLGTIISGASNSIGNAIGGISDGERFAPAADEEKSPVGSFTPLNLLSNAEKFNEFDRQAFVDPSEQKDFGLKTS